MTLVVYDSCGAGGGAAASGAFFGEGEGKSAKWDGEKRPIVPLTWRFVSA